MAKITPKLKHTQATNFYSRLWTCGGLNRNDPTDSYLNAWHIRSGTIRRYVLVGGSVPLWRLALRSYMLKLGLVSQSPPAICTSRWENSQRLLQHQVLPQWKWTKPLKQIKCFPLWELLWSWCLFITTETLTKTDHKRKIDKHTNKPLR